MDLNRIFGLFNTNEDDDTSLLIDFSEHPLFWVSGFNKVIDNHLYFKEYTLKTFSTLSSDINIEELEKAGEELMFRKAWNYIKSIDLNNNLHLDSIKVKANENFIKNLQISISFFEQFEEYEKCALLKGIEIKVKDFLK